MIAVAGDDESDSCANDLARSYHCPVDIRDLDYFLACCKAGSFTAAAREVHIVQSAMSCAIARLEKELGSTLFYRNMTPLALTEHGVALQAPAQRILDAVQAARDEVAAVSGQVRGTVTLGSTLHTGRIDLAGVLADIRDRHPDVVIKLRQWGSAELVQAVRDGSVDIALTANQRGNAPRGIEMHQLFSEAMVFVCRPDHPLSHRSSVAVPDLREETILRPPPGWGTRTIIDAAFGATQSAYEIANYSLMARLVREGFATTLAPESAIIGDMLNGLCAIPVDDAQLRWTLSTAVRTDRRMTAATTVLLRALTQRSHVSAAQVPAIATALPTDRRDGGG
jgi:DNA-binding transcriptional LysR family regulator